MNRAVFGFVIDRNRPLVQEAERAVERIYTAGIMIRDGRIGPGGNNVMADNAANAFSAADLKALKAGSDRAQGFAAVIALRQAYAAAPAQNLLEAIVTTANALKEGQWRPEAEPVRLQHGRPMPRPQ